MYEDRTHNYNPAIHEEYLVHDTSFHLPHHLYPSMKYRDVESREIGVLRTTNNSWMDNGRTDDDR